MLRDLRPHVPATVHALRHRGSAVHNVVSAAALDDFGDNHHVGYQDFEVTTALLAISAIEYWPLGIFEKMRNES
jgi:hypothetical protein